MEWNRQWSPSARQVVDTTRSRPRESMCVLAQTWLLLNLGGGKGMGGREGGEGRRGGREGGEGRRGGGEVRGG